jgi:hypothetical protein
MKILILSTFVTVVDSSSPSSSLHGLGESPVPASSIVISLHRLLGLSMSRLRDG